MEETDLRSAEDRLLKAMTPQKEPEAAEPETEAPDVQDAPEALEPENADEDRYVVKVDGEEIEVTFDELVRSYQGSKAARKALAEAGEARKKAQEELLRVRQMGESFVSEAEKRRQEVEAKLSEYETLIPQVKKPSYDLFQKDPLGYMEQQAQFEEYTARVEQIRAERDRIRQEREKEFSQRQTQWEQAEYAQLVRQVPDFQKGETFGAVEQYLAKTYGLPPEQLREYVKNVPLLKAHPIWVSFYKAMKYDEAKASKAGAGPAQAATRTLPPGTARKPQSVASRKVSETRTRLAKEGTVDAATAHLANILGKR